MLDNYRKILFENGWSIRQCGAGMSFLTGAEYVLWGEASDKPYSFFPTMADAVSWCEELVKECEEYDARMG